MSAPLLQVDHVSLESASAQRVVRATHGVRFDVHEADRFVLLGPSGCGKSILLKAVAGFVAPRKGQVRLEGHAVSGPGPDRVVVFQEFDQLAPWKTVRENVVFGLRAARKLGRGEARERADESLAQVELSAFADAYPHTLSGGIKQRVAIARTLAMRPRVLLMDEPFAALDALTRSRMQEQVLELWEQLRFTLLFVTHSIEEALVSVTASCCCRRTRARCAPSSTRMPSARTAPVAWRSSRPRNAFTGCSSTCPMRRWRRQGGTVTPPLRAPS